MLVGLALVSGLTSFAIVASGSRVALTALVISVALLVRLWQDIRSRPTLVTIVVGVAAGCAISLLAGASDRLERKIAASAAVDVVHEDSFLLRTEMWRFSLEELTARPLFGLRPDGLGWHSQPWDPDTYPALSRLSDATGNIAMVASPHSFPLEFLASFGIVGVAIILVGLLALFRFASSRSTSSQQDIFDTAGIAGFAGFALLNPVAVASLGSLAVVLGMVATRKLRPQSNAPQASSAGYRLSLVAVAACLTIAVLTALRLAP